MDLNKIAIFGTGRVGLPLALVLADKGLQVLGIDIDPHRISLLNHKIMPFMEEGAQALLEKYAGNKFQIFSQSHLSRVISESKTIILTLGTPIDDTYSPNFKQLEELIISMTPFIKEGHLVILRSTVSPGATEQFARQLEEQTKLKIGESLFLAYCPERIAEGRSIEELGQIPQLVGSIEPESAKRAANIFKKIAPKVIISTPKSVELAKLFCNMYRYIDLAIGNEFMMIAEDYGCNYYEVLNLVNNDYKRGGLKSPGFTAGPCLVKDGFFLIDKSPYMELVIAAWRLNENIPGYILKRIKSEIKDLHKKKVAILGLAFKKNIDDARFSLSPKLQRYFEAEGTKVFVHDPFIDSQPLDDVVLNADIVILGTNHSVFQSLNLEYFKKRASPDCLIFDIWNILGTGKIQFYLKSILGAKKQITPKSNGEIKNMKLKNHLKERSFA